MGAQASTVCKNSLDVSNVYLGLRTDVENIYILETSWDFQGIKEDILGPFFWIQGISQHQAHLKSCSER